MSTILADPDGSTEALFRSRDDFLFSFKLHLLIFGATVEGNHWHTINLFSRYVDMFWTMAAIRPSVAPEHPICIARIQGYTSLIPLWRKPILLPATNSLRAVHVQIMSSLHQSWPSEKRKKTRVSQKKKRFPPQKKNIHLPPQKKPLPLLARWHPPSPATIEVGLDTSPRRLSRVDWWM